MCIINEPKTEKDFGQTTTSTLDQFVAGLMKSGPGCSNVSSNIPDAYPKVHHRGRSEADVTQGSTGVWDRLLNGWFTSEMATAEQDWWGRH